MFTQDILDENNEILATVFVSPWYDENGQTHEYEGKCWLEPTKFGTLIHFDPIVQRSIDGQPLRRIEITYEGEIFPPLKLTDIEIRLTDTEKINLCKKEFRGIMMALTDLDQPETNEISERLGALLRILEEM